jgi:20S proteasome subunit beta 7
MQQRLSTTLSFLFLLMSFPVSHSAPNQHTTRPMVTGTSVVGICYEGGVLLAADTLLSYGSMAKSQCAQRLHIVGSTTGGSTGSTTSSGSVIVGASGEYSDYTKLCRLLDQQDLQERRTVLMSDSQETEITAESTWNYLRMILYSKRNQMNPYWNSVLVAGFGNSADSSKPFLGMVDPIGTTVHDNVLATGFGAWLALPLLREQWHAHLTEGEARALLEDCMKVLFLRDCRASPQIQLAKVTRTPEGKVTTAISEPYLVETQWESAEFMRPVADLDGDGGW